ncbi:MAG TPA: type II secretion system protein [Blastocatellia bacterium]|nr:type II secretion system protein [Blastocatellia bacterium]
MRKQRGFSMLEVITVAAVIGTAVAVSAPSLTRAMRSYRLSAGAQQIAGAIQTAKLRAIGANQSQSIFFDTTNNTIAVANAATVVSLPSGIQFVTPTVDAPPMVATAITNAASIPNQQSDPHAAVSFPVGSPTTVREAVFNWRGLPAVSPGAVNWVYLTNTQGELMAVTLSSAGSVNVWRWDPGASSWVSSKHG